MGAVVRGAGAMARLSLLPVTVAILAFLLPVLSHGEQLMQEESTLETTSRLWKKYSSFQTEDGVAAVDSATDAADALTTGIVELRRGVLEVHESETCQSILLFCGLHDILH
jgi:hypothetical protein